MEGIFPAWFYWFYLGRYVAIALQAIYYLNSTNFILESNWYGKWSAGITTFSIILHIFPIAQLSWLPQFTLYIATGLLTFSYLKYVRTFYQASKQS
jgi:phosphatidylglycerophosphate synthase